MIILHIKICNKRYKGLFRLHTLLSFLLFYDIFFRRFLPYAMLCHMLHLAICRTSAIYRCHMLHFIIYRIFLYVVFRYILRFPLSYATFCHIPYFSICGILPYTTFCHMRRFAICRVFLIRRFAGAAKKYRTASRNTV